jgi:hypothetical protein
MEDVYISANGHDGQEPFAEMDPCLQSLDHRHLHSLPGPLAPQRREQLPIIPTFGALHLLVADFFNNQVSVDFLIPLFLCTCIGVYGMPRT